MSSGDPKTRKRILEKTWQLMEKNHRQAVRIDDIAQAVGVSRQAVYLHFGSRAELLVATVRYVDEMHGIKDRLKSINAAQDGVELLDAFVEFWGNYIPEIHGLAKALLESRKSDAAAAAAWDDRMSELRAGCKNTIDCLIRNKELASEWKAGQAVDALWSMMSIAVWENLTIDCGWTNSEYISRMKAMLRRVFVK
jgi:AcrR family transcriptional regulator